MLNTSSVLDTAANLITENGWFQGAVDYDSPALCANMAIGDAVRMANNIGTAVTYGVAARALLNHITDATISLDQPARGNAIVRWNDEFGRTQDEVVQALRGAAQRYKEA